MTQLDFADKNTLLCNNKKAGGFGKYLLGLALVICGSCLLAKPLLSKLTSSNTKLPQSTKAIGNIHSKRTTPVVNSSQPISEISTTNLSQKKHQQQQQARQILNNPPLKLEKIT